MNKKVVSSCLLGVLLCTTTLIQANPLVWNTMEVRETTPKASQGNTTSLSGDALAGLIASMQEQYNQNTALILTAMQQQTKQPDQANAITAMQQQQQQLMNSLLQLQQQQQDLLRMLGTANQTKADDSVTTLLLKHILNEKGKGEPINQEPIVQFTAFQQPEPVAEVIPEIPYERKRLAPPDEPPTAKSPLDHIAEAVQDAAMEGYYQNSMAVFQFVDTGLYKIYCKPGYLTVIRLQPGETFRTISGGDTARWVFDVTATNNQSQIMVKPTQDNLDTNFVIVTDKHSYQVQAKTATWYNPVVSWSYPLEDKGRALKQEQARVKEQQETIPLAVKAEKLNFEYKVSGKSRNNAWKPKVIFDNGKKVYIQMTEAMKNSSMPSLVVKEGDGTIIVNYRMQNGYYIVDRLFNDAELLINQKSVVRIKRSTPLNKEE